MEVNTATFDRHLLEIMQISMLSKNEEKLIYFIVPSPQHTLNQKRTLTSKHRNRHGNLRYLSKSRWMRRFDFSSCLV